MTEPQDRTPTHQHLLHLHSQRRFADCEQAARAALQDDPSDGVVWKVLGVVLAAQGKDAEALEAKLRAARLLPRDVEAILNLANSFARAGRLAKAAKCHERVCALEPGSAMRLNDWGNALREAHLMPEARVAYERALAIEAGFAEALSNLGNTLADLGFGVQAEQRYREALALLPAQAVIHSNLGNLLKLQGRHAEALACYRAAMDLSPDFAGARSNYLLALNHVPGISSRQIKEEAQAFGRWASARAGRVERKPRASDAPLRVGFVSGDLRAHPVGYFLESVLAHWPHDIAQLHAYPTVRIEDALTGRIRARFAAWRPIAHLDDAQAAQLIADDVIDVLVDLAGHTAYGRPTLFAWKPAPVQATWLGYFATTGVRQIDWIVSDAVSIPPQEEDRFTERVWRLPGTRLCFTPPAEAPAVEQLPALHNGFITFGSFQNLGKINDGVLALWSRVLSQVPGSRLRIQNGQLGDAQARDAFLARLAHHGIDAERASLHAKASRLAYLHAHEEVDVILDTFPYPGGTTMCEALWMGVPTVTLAGETMLARQGESLLAAANLRGWIARDEAQFVDIASSAAMQAEKLARMRAGLRNHLAASPLFDARRFAGELAKAFSQMSEQMPAQMSAQTSGRL